MKVHVTKFQILEGHCKKEFRSPLKNFLDPRMKCVGLQMLYGPASWGGIGEGKVGMQPIRLYGSALVIMVPHMRLATL